MAYEAVLSQDIPWFDQQDNTAGAICARLAKDAAAVQGVNWIYLDWIANIDCHHLGYWTSSVDDVSSRIHTGQLDGGWLVCQLENVLHEYASRSIYRHFNHLHWTTG